MAAEVQVDRRPERGHRERRCAHVDGIDEPDDIVLSHVHGIVDVESIAVAHRHAKPAELAQFSRQRRTQAIVLALRIAVADHQDGRIAVWSVGVHRILAGHRQR